MPRVRLVLCVALLVSSACSAGAPSPAASPTRTAGAPSPSKPAAPTTPRVIVERDRTLLVIEGGVERRLSVAGFYPGGSRTGEPPVAVSPNGRWVLAFTATRPGWFVLPVAGGAPVRLPGSAKLPVWSRDSTIAYVADGDLHLAVPGGRDVRLLAPAPEGCCFGLAWSPDGRRIAMEGFDRTLGREQIWVVDRTGKNLERLWTGPARTSTRGWALGFSPTGERVVSANAEPALSVSLRGRDRPLAGEPVVRDHGFTWWRNRVLVSAKAEPDRLAWEDPATGDQIVLAEPVAFATETALAPSGSPLGITLVRREDSKTALFTVRPDGSALKRLVEWGEEVGSIAWSRDGGWLVYETPKSRTIRAVAIAGGSVRTLGTGRFRAVL